MNDQVSIKTISDKDIWENHVSTHQEANFLTSWHWGEFHRKLGKTVFYLGIYDKDSLEGICLVVKEEAKRGNYLTVAGGPLINWSKTSHQEILFNYLKELAQAHSCLFIRVRPQILDTSPNQAIFSHLGFVRSPMHLTADLTLQLDLGLSHEALLAQMRKNTRYEIKKAQKLDIRVSQSSDPSDIKEFDRHQQTLAAKHNFVPFSYTFLHTQFKVFASEEAVRLFHAYHQDKLLASAFVIMYGQEAVYHYGISTPANNRLPGAYACQWAAILEAKKRGLSRYNFWGIAPKDATEHRFAGVSLFKRGFGGDEVAYLPAHDLPVSKLYQATRAFEMVRAKLRHLD